jgi:hypothetical protein
MTETAAQRAARQLEALQLRAANAARYADAGNPGGAALYAAGLPDQVRACVASAEAAALEPGFKVWAAATIREAQAVIGR